MKVRVILCTALCVGLSLAVNSLAKTKSNNMVQRANQNKRYCSPFRYVMISNEVSNLSGDPKDANRTVSVLLDEKAFSEETLKEVFKLVTKRFPEPKRLDVWVYTSLEQLDTPEERDRGVISESDNNPVSDNYHWALFFRSQDGDEVFRYNPNPPNTNMKTVILKGRDPHGPRR